MDYHSANTQFCTVSDIDKQIFLDQLNNEIHAQWIKNNEAIECDDTNLD